LAADADRVFSAADFDFEGKGEALSFIFAESRVRRQVRKFLYRPALRALKLDYS
jgi:hypothetical protein